MKLQIFALSGTLPAYTQLSGGIAKQREKAYRYAIRCQSDDVLARPVGEGAKGLAAAFQVDRSRLARALNAST